MTALLLAGAFAAPVDARSPQCNRARLIVDDVKAAWDSPRRDPRAILEKLKTAHQLCPALAEAWTYAYCSAAAIGDEQNAQIYKGRAIFNGAEAFACEDGLSSAVRPGPPGPVRQKFALVIGIGTFQDPAIPPLQYAAKDARDFAALLADPKHGNFERENIILLTDAQATRAAILNALQRLFVEAQENDLVVTYVSSHGSPAEQARGLGGIGHVVTYDTNLKKIWVDALEYEDLAEKVSLLKARRKVTFLDTCFSGEAAKRGEKALAIEGIGVNERTAKMFLSGEGTFVIVSSKDDERSWESDQIQNSYFTYYLIEALKQSKEPPTLKEIFDYLSVRVPRAVARDKEASQHPQMRPSGGAADVRIGVIPQESKRP